MAVVGFAVRRTHGLTRFCGDRWPRVHGAGASAANPQTRRIPGKALRMILLVDAPLGSGAVVKILQGGNSFEIPIEDSETIQFDVM
ncbi:hypothetical protein GCM10027432_07740 [Lysobacter fragariae]